MKFKTTAVQGLFFLQSAEIEGFEPPVQLPVHRISSAAHSTTLAAFQSDCKVTNYLIKRTQKDKKITGEFDNS